MFYRPAVKSFFVFKLKRLFTIYSLYTENKIGKLELEGIKIVMVYDNNRNQGGVVNKRYPNIGKSYYHNEKSFQCLKIFSTLTIIQYIN